MAIKPDRFISETDISYVCNDVVDKGIVLVYATGSTSASGAGISSPGAVEKASDPSGRIPAGLSLANFVNIDQTRQHRNYHKDEQIIGENVPLLKKGAVVTDQIMTGLTILPGQTAYLGVSGLLTNATGSTGQNPKVGQFATKKDADNFVKVLVELPSI